MSLVGSNFATRWGSVGFFGPLTVRPDLWARGVGKQLMEPVMGCFDTWKVEHAGLFTFAHSQTRRPISEIRFLAAFHRDHVEGSSANKREPQWSKYLRSRERTTRMLARLRCVDGCPIRRTEFGAGNPCRSQPTAR